MNFGSIVSMDWQSTAEGETLLQHFYNPQTSGRKLFGEFLNWHNPFKRLVLYWGQIVGVLERPAVPPSVEEVSYKLFVVGNAASGKTATISRLAGTKSSSSYVETLGIQKTNVYWPVKIWDKIIMFKLQFWEAGDTSIRKYSHISAACEHKSDAIVFVYSFADRASFTDLPQMTAKWLRTSENPTSVIIGTRVNSTGQMAVSSSDAKEFEAKYQIPVLKIENRWSPERNEVHEVAPILNIICERLWSRDQEYLLKQGLAR